MSDPRADEAGAAIQEILWSDWDPIGCGVPRDEYDSYIRSIYLLLYAGWNEDKIEGELRRIEREWMGLSGSGAGAKVAARKLVALGYAMTSPTSP
jgi:hypothetical protein